LGEPHPLLRAQAEVLCEVGLIAIVEPRSKPVGSGVALIWRLVFRYSSAVNTEERASSTGRGSSIANEDSIPNRLHVSEPDQGKARLL